jgi:hypothetical protein
MWSLHELYTNGNFKFKSAPSPLTLKLFAVELIGNGSKDMTNFSHTGIVL